MICARCGHENQAGANFCSSCGAALEKSEDDTTVTLAIEDRAELDDELGAMLAEIPAGTGVVVVRRGPNAGSRFSLERDVTTVGRHPDSDIFLDDITVSRRHAVIRRDRDGYEVSDAGSLNGTYVNRERVETAPLRHLDEVQVGRFVLLFMLGGVEEHA
ncbi:MAG TPA: FHA domain-containing protein [Acidimicrobiia bacterium]|nr:FHA domain-containing protein [Acidimicrobiia bacterium]